MRFLNTFLLLVAFSVSTETFAQNVFLVQLGSYESEKEADSTWNSLKKENKTLLADLFHQNSAISLPPSDAKVYRLQAGPFITREDASSVCNELAQKGTDCFIVESAGFAPKEPPVTSARAMSEPVETAPTAQPEATLASLPAELPASPKGSIALAADTPVNVSAEKETAAEKTESPSLFDQLAEAFTDSGESAPAKETVAEIAKPADTDVAPPAIIAKPEEKPAQLAENAAAEPALPWHDAPVEKKKVKASPKVDEPKVETPVQSNSLPAKLPFGRVGDPYTPIAAPSHARKEMLPPPAATGTLPMPQTVEAEKGPTSIPVPAAAKAEDAQENVPDSTPHRLSQNDIISPTDKRVEVGEAIAVPPSEGVERKPLTSTPFNKAMATKEPVLSGKRALGWNASPSRNLLQHAYWVQLSYFKTEQAALNEWQLLREKMPNLSSQMRVRITKPYVRHSAEEHISLQVGPFLSTQDVSKLCAFAASEDIRCNMSKDLGVSTAASQPRSNLGEAGYLQPQDVVSFRPGATAQYWIQLGSYRSRGDASKAWEEFRMKNTELQSYLPVVSQPALSSSPEPVYRLRTGPFQIRYAAQELCDQLRNRATGCIVVSE